MFDNVDNEEMERYHRMFSCEHSTLTTILIATTSQLRDIPLELCHPSMAATLLAINSLKAAAVAAAVHDNKELARLLQRMCNEVLEVIDKFHHEGLGENQDIPDVFKKAFEKE